MSYKLLLQIKFKPEKPSVEMINGIIFFIHEELLVQTK